MEEKELCENAATEDAYLELRNEIQALVSSVSQTISTHDKLKDKNFGLFYQHGRLGYVDLDMFAKTVDTEGLLKAKSITEENDIVDKEEE